MVSRTSGLGITKVSPVKLSLKPKHSANIAGTDFGHIFAMIGIHADQTSNAFSSCPLVEFMTVCPWLNTPE